MDYPYFNTWTKQENAPTFNVLSTSVDTYQTDSGSVYDLSSCSYHLSFGLRNSDIEEAIIQQIKTLPLSGPKSVFDLKTDTTNELLKYLELSGKIFYTVSGAEAVENAFKIARTYTGKKHIISRRNSYHGATMGALSATGDWRRNSQVIQSDFYHFIPGHHEENSIPELEQLVERLKGKVAAICLETITGGNGVYESQRDWWLEVRRIANENNILIILDEVICGFERTNESFAFQEFNFKPDLVCLSKGITGGFIPFGAVYTNKEIASYFDTNILPCGLTNYAPPLGLAALSTVLKIVRTAKFKNNKEELNKLLLKFKEDVIKIEGISDARVNGCLMAIEFFRGDFSWKYFCDNGLYINVVNGNIILAPILVTSPQSLSKALKKLLSLLQKKIHA